MSVIPEGTNASPPVQSTPLEIYASYPFVTDETYQVRYPGTCSPHQITDDIILEARSREPCSRGRIRRKSAT